MTDLRANTTFVKALGDAVQGLGHDGFNLTLLEVLKSIIPSRKTVIATYSKHSPSDITFCEGSPVEITELFRREYYNIDPFYAWWRSYGRPGVVPLSMTLPEGRKSNAYSAIYLKQANISDEMGVFFPPFGDESTALFLERSKGKYSDSDINAMRRLYPLLTKLHHAHIMRICERFDSRKVFNRPTMFLDKQGKPSLLSSSWTKEHSDLLEAISGSVKRPGSYLIDSRRLFVAERVAPDFPIAPRGLMIVLADQGKKPVAIPSSMPVVLSPDLTKRENDVISLVLRGFDNKAIAENLSISYGTVKNYRLNIYQKLEIGTERELFIRYLEHLHQQT